MIENIRIFERTDCWGATWYWTNKDDCWSQFACVDEKAKLFATEIASQCKEFNALIWRELPVNKE